MDLDSKENFINPENQPKGVEFNLDQSASVENLPAVEPVESAPASTPEALPVETQPQESADLRQDYQPIGGETEEAVEKEKSNAERLAPLGQEERLSELKAIAKEGKLEEAIAISKKMGDPWLEDKFHDDLMNDPDLRPQLERMGKIEKL